MRALGLDHAQPVRMEGTLLPAHRRHLPDLRRAAPGDRMGGVRSRQRSALRALRDSLGLRTFGGLRGGRFTEGERPEHGVDVDGLTFACAMTVEQRIARRFGRTALVGLGASKGVPDGRIVSFGIAGAVLWEGGPLGAAPARTGTILGATRIVDDPAERARLHLRTGAEAVDMESGPLARSGRLVGCLRAVSDTPTRRLGGVAEGAKPDGQVDYLGFLRGFLREPVVTARAALGARRALKSLEALA